MTQQSLHTLIEVSYIHEHFCEVKDCFWGYEVKPEKQKSEIALS